MKTFILIFISILSFNVFAGHKNHVSVSGSCKKEVYPDRTMIIYNVSIISKSHKESNKKASDVYNQIKEYVENQNLKDVEIATTHYTTQPHQPWENGKQVMKGFETRIGLKVVTSSLDELSQMLTFAVGKEGTSVDGPNPFVSRKTYEKVYKDCLQIATADALEKAKILAHSLKAEVGKVLKISEGYADGGGRPEMMFAKSARAYDGASSSPNIVLGKEEIQVNVGVEFELK